jgi:hypothetical protein
VDILKFKLGLKGNKLAGKELFQSMLVQILSNLAVFPWNKIPMRLIEYLRK